MAATITDSGTWTTLTTDLSAHPNGNVPGINNEKYPDFQGPMISEIDQFLVLLMTAYSCTYWQAWNFLRQQLAVAAQDVPSTGAAAAQ